LFFWFLVFMHISQALQEFSKRLAGVSETPSLDAQTLLAHILGASRTWVLAHPEASLNPAQEQALHSAGDRLEAGEALPYVLGHWEFYGLDFIVTPDVLIPRPETELLVEHALEWLHAHPGRRNAADVGSGSGCIAVSLAVNCPDLHILATDVSLPALEIAKANAEQHGVADRVRFIKADLSDLPGDEAPEGLPVTHHASRSTQFDLILANLPYIPTTRLASLAVAQREPRLALDGGPDGLDLIRGLMPAARRWLAPGGCCLLEIDASRGEAALDLAQSVFPQAKVAVIPDLAGLDRLLQVS
jgi:release factor glutamine methyltransferase